MVRTKADCGGAYRKGMSRAGGAMGGRTAEPPLTALLSSQCWPPELPGRCWAPAASTRDRRRPPREVRAGRGRGSPSSLPARPAAGLTAALPAGEGCRGGGNPVCMRPVPTWQRGIGEFLQLLRKENRAPGAETAGSSGLGPAAKKARPLPPDPAEDGESSEEE
ncbi:hypothetical protein QYF61_012229 [Mycteria americana]|uniref:PCNA-associated factor n=1 Tax=Mycteria americana TaxID=33587 RepID=A0AAN7NAH7_MYCAM|nr:hypothetical protein QYF61_012229 [Mycteria americana]